MQNLANITAAILAGGRGTRLRPVVVDRPKVLARVGGRPFLTYLLDQLASAGVGHVVLCTGYLGEQVQAAFGDTYGSLHLTYSQEPEPLDTAGALRFALPLLKSDPVLAMNGDSFCQADLGAFRAYHRNRVASATLLLTEVPDIRRYGRVHTAPDGCVLRFVEKGANDGSGWISAGVYLLSHQLLYSVPAGEAVSLERDSFPAWVGRGLSGHKSRGQFLDIGTPDSYARAEEFFSQTTRRVALPARAGLQTESRAALPARAGLPTESRGGTVGRPATAGIT